MPEYVQLEGTWKVRGEFLDVGPERVQEVLRREEGEFKVGIMNPNAFPLKKGFMDMRVPGDVLTPLVDSGNLEEPFLKENTKDCLWVKDLSWWFIRDFELPQELLENDELRLFIEVLDYKADIIINGIPAGRHMNAFCPYEEDVKRYLQAGTNQIVIRLTSGVEDRYPKDSVSVYCSSPHAVYDQRVYLRKPQFTYGWDWCQPVPTCGIGGSVRLEGLSGAKISSFRADTVSLEADGCARLKLCFELDKMGMCASDGGIVTYEILSGGSTVLIGKESAYLTGGLNYLETEVCIPDAALWWPNGYGEQNLYVVKASCSCRNVTNDMKPVKIGIRTIQINHSKLEDGTRNFYFEVNGVRVFCKGGNWVPTDSVYLRTPETAYRTLVEEAKNANFTMFRMWGGGTYEPDCFYEYCSEAGILVMQDFMYACGYYPDHLDWFLYEAGREAEYQTKRLAHFACMAVWTGNNEIHESYTDWFRGPIAADRNYGVKIFNYIQPQAVKHNSPLIPYMPSSPYFGDRANALDAGDVHAWNYFGRDKETGFSFRYELEAFDRIPARFSSEYGFFGAQMESTVRRYLDGGEMSFHNPAWIHHGEFGRKREGIDEPIERHLTDFDKLDEKQYLLYSGVMQGCLYLEMAEAMRRKTYGAGDLIWMYNDCWPETGWTIIDYYLTRKISFYYLKRGFAPVKFIVRRTEDAAQITLINETERKLSVPAEYGYMDFYGNTSREVSEELELPPHSFRQFEFEAAGDQENGFYYIRALDASVDTACSLRAYYRDYVFPDTEPVILEEKMDGPDMLVTVQAEHFIPAAYLKFQDDRTKCSDNYFPLFPGESKTIRIYASGRTPELAAVRMMPKMKTGGYAIVE